MTWRESDPLRALSHLAIFLLGMFYGICLGVVIGSHFAQPDVEVKGGTE